MTIIDDEWALVMRRDRQICDLINRFEQIIYNENKEFLVAAVATGALAAAYSAHLLTNFGEEYLMHVSQACSQYSERILQSMGDVVTLDGPDDFPPE